MAENPVLSDPDLSVPITLVHENGSETATRGVVGRRPAGATGFEGSFDDTGLTAWTPPPASRSPVASVRVADTEYETLESDETMGAVFASGAFGSARFLLREASAVTTARDFDPIDFSTEDFN